MKNYQILNNFYVSNKAQAALQSVLSSEMVFFLFFLLQLLQLLQSTQSTLPSTGRTGRGLWVM